MTEANRIERGGAGFGAGPHAREFEQHAATGGIVDGAVIDVVALGTVFVDSEVIVVRSVKNCFAFAARIRPSSLATTLRESNGRMSLAIWAFNVTDSSMGLKSRDCALLIKLVEIETGHATSFLRDIELDPRGSLQFRRTIPLQVGSFAAPRVAHHFPRIAGDIGAMNDQRGDGAVTGSLLIFVDPPPL